MDKINQIWPSWHTVELIGRGGFGEVYKAKREQLGEIFYSAVKIIQIPKEDSEIKEMLAEGHTSQSVRYYYESVVKGLMNEIKVMDALKSAGNVVTIEEFEVIEKENSIGWDAYIRMELLQNLNDYRAEHRMGPAEVAKLGADLCEALICCEKSHIIHRDIKPSNIFVDKYGTFKLGDFGIAREMEKTQSTLSRKGTELYMAPEIRYGKSGSTYNVDIYSLGLVMYRLLNRNRMPFEPLEKELMSYQEREEALVRRLEGAPMPLPADCDPQLGLIIRKACEYDKTIRYQSAYEMREDLAAWLRKEPSAKLAGETERNAKPEVCQATADPKIEKIEEDKTLAAFDKTMKTAWDKEKQPVGEVGKEVHTNGKALPEEPDIHFAEKKETASATEKETLPGRKIKRIYMTMMICTAVSLCYMFNVTYWFYWRFLVRSFDLDVQYFPLAMVLQLALSSLLLCGVSLIKKERKAGRLLCTAGGFWVAWRTTVIWGEVYRLEPMHSSVYVILFIFSALISILFYKWSGELCKGKEAMSALAPEELRLTLCGIVPLSGSYLLISSVRYQTTSVEYAYRDFSALFGRLAAYIALCVLIFLGIKFVKEGKKAGVSLCTAGGMLAGYYAMVQLADTFLYGFLELVMIKNQNEWFAIQENYSMTALHYIIPIVAGVIVAILCYRWARKLLARQINKK